MLFLHIAGGRITYEGIKRNLPIYGYLKVTDVSVCTKCVTENKIPNIYT